MEWRSVQTIINLVIQQVQFIGLLGNLDIKWPSQFKEFLNGMSLFNLDPQDLIGDQEIPVIDFRVLFILISVICPIFLTLLILLFYLPLSRVVWFFMITVGSVLFVAGLLGRYLPSAGVGDDAASTAEVYLVIGGAFIGAAILFALIHYVKKRRAEAKLTEEEKDDVERFERERVYLMKFHRKRSFAHFAAASLLIISGLVLIGVVDFNLSYIEGQADSTIAGMITIIAYTSLVVGCFIGIYFFVNLFACGRKATDAVRIFLKNNLLMILILLISASYVPSMTYCMNMFMCAKYECPEGTVFSPYAKRDVSSFSTSETLFCDPCTFQNPSCPALQKNANVSVATLCPATSLSRNWQNPEVSCEDESVGYFFFAAAVVLMVYLICIPLLYRKLIINLTYAVHQRSQYPGREDYTALRPDHWLISLAVVRPAAATLYEPFMLSHKFYSILMLFHRLIVVTVIVVLSPFSTAAIPLILVIHAIACVFLLYFKPYLIPLEQGLAIGMAICNVLNGMFAVIVWQQDGETPAYATGIYIVLNIILPIFFTLAMNIYVYRRHSKTRQDAGVEPVSDEEEEVDEHGNKIPKFKKLEDIKISEEERKEIAKQNNVVCTVLNQSTGEMMGKFFMVMGVFFFLALGACVLGTLRSKESKYVIGTNRLQRNIKYTMNDMNWANFTSSCCCLNARNPSGVFNISERWVCQDGNIIDRGRVSNELANDARPLRGVCEETFVERCEVRVTTDNVGKVWCPDDTRRTTLVNVTDKAFDYYW